MTVFKLIYDQATSIPPILQSVCYNFYLFSTNCSAGGGVSKIRALSRQKQWAQSYLKVYILLWIKKGPLNRLAVMDNTPKRIGIMEARAIEHISWMSYIVLCVFFTSYSMSAQSLAAEMPVFVQRAPEGQDLPAIIAIMSSCSFIGPLCYIVCRKYIKWRPKRWVFPLMLMLTLGLLQILMAFTWDVTTTISGSQHSLFLLLWAMLGYITDGIVIVQYPVFMEGFGSQYVSSIYVGDAICGLLTSCTGMIQGVGDNECINVTQSTNLTDVNANKFISVSSPPLFTVTIFHILMFIIICTCIAAFIWISFSTNSSPLTVGSDILACPIIESENTRKEIIPLASKNKSTIIENNTMSIAPSFQRYTLFVLIFINCFLFRMYHLSIIQYACQSYTNATYSLATRSSLIVRSLATPCALLLRVRSLVIMVLITALGLVMEAYIICVGVMSPDPPLKGTETGSNIVVSMG